MNIVFLILPTKKCHVKIIFSSFIVQNCFVTGEKSKGLVHDREEKKNQKKTVKKRILLCFWAIEHLKIDKRYRHPSCKKALMEGWRHKSKRIGCERRTSLQPIILASLGKFNSKIIKLIVCLIVRKLWKVAKFQKKIRVQKIEVWIF